MSKEMTYDEKTKAYFGLAIFVITICLIIFAFVMSSVIEVEQQENNNHYIHEPITDNRFANCTVLIQPTKTIYYCPLDDILNYDGVVE